MIYLVGGMQNCGKSLLVTILAQAVKADNPEHQVVANTNQFWCPDAVIYKGKAMAEFLKRVGEEELGNLIIMADEIDALLSHRLWKKQEQVDALFLIEHVIPDANVFPVSHAFIKPLGHRIGCGVELACV